MSVHEQAKGTTGESASPPRHLDKPPGSPASDLQQARTIRVLVVEDAPEVVDGIVLSLATRWPGASLIATGSGHEAVRLARYTRPDIILLDLTLNDQYGLAVLKEVLRFSNTPVIIITANSQEATRRMSFEMGATDYLIKPFSYIDLLSSVYTALGRSGETQRRRNEISLIGRGIVVDLVSRRLLLGGDEVGLTGIEWRLFAALVHDHGQTVSLARLAQAGWGRQSVSRSSLAACIRHLRLKLGDDLSHPMLIQLQRNEGYKLNLFH